MHPYQLSSLFACLFLIGSAEVVAGPMMGFMGADFSVPSSDIAYLPAAYGLSYGLIAILAGPLSDRFGRKRPLQVGLLGYAIFNALLPSAAQLCDAVLLSGLAGCCAAVIQPNALSLVGDQVAPADVGRYLGKVFIGLMLAFVLTPAIAGLVADTLGWRAAYYGLSGLAVAVLGAVSMAFPRVGQCACQPVAFHAVHLGAIRTKGARPRLAASYLWLGWVAGFGAVVAEVSRHALPLSPTDAGLLAAFYGVAVIAGNLASPWLHRMWGSAALPAIAALSALGIAAFLLPVASVAQLAFAGLPWAFGYGCAGPLHHAALSALSDRYRGTINSYHASLLNIGIFSVSFLLGAVTTDRSVTVFCLAASFVALCGAAMLWSARGGRANLEASKGGT